MKTRILVVSFLVATMTVVGQSGKLKKADNYFQKLSYSYASLLYEELLGGEMDSPKMKSNLAICYYNTGEMKKSEATFAQMINSDVATREDFFYYAQALKQNGNYAESDLWMEKFNKIATNDTRGLSYVNNPTYMEKIEKQGVHFTIANLSCNTPSADFGGYPSTVNNDAYFVSSRRKRVFVQNEWSWNSKRFLDLYKSTIAGTSELENVQLITKKVNTRFHEGPMCFTFDGKHVYFTRNNIEKGANRKDQKGIQNLKLYRATVDSKGNWTNEEVLSFNSKEYSVGHPSITSDGKTLYFASDMPGGFGGADLYKVALNADGSYGKPENLGKQFNTEGQEMFPWISNDGHLFFSSNGHIGLGGLDVFVMLPNKNGGFDKLMNVGKPVNGQYDDFAFTMNKDNQTGYFSSNREGGKGDDDIYSYVLSKPFKQNLVVEGIVADLQTKDILPGSTVYLKDDKGMVFATTTADDKGAYSFELEPDKNYVVAASKDKYYGDLANFSTVNLNPDMETIKQNLELEKDPGLALYCLVTDGKSSLPIEGVKLTIIDKTNGSEFLSTTTPETGDAKKGIDDKKINDLLSYTIKLEKEGYLSKTVVYSQRIVKPGIINVHEELDLTMDKLDIGMDLATLIDIKPIYFDLGKYAIRKDAALELDKIVKVMNDYPTMQIELGSHTDCRSSYASNEKLSTNRANASAAYIKARIKNPERIYGKGYGEYKLKVDCPCEGAVKSTCTEAEHQQNRRTEFVIIKM
jgi:outer membrane protein OmpA-like peptidoglycan-associated protein